MVFSSAISLFFFVPIVFLLDRRLPNVDAKNTWLLLASLVFYSFGQVYYLPLLLLGYMIALSAAAFTIWTALLGKFPVGKVSLFGFLIPVFGTLFSALVLGENIFTARNLAALVLVSGGIAVANSASTKK